MTILYLSAIPLRVHRLIVARRYALSETLTEQLSYQLVYCHSVWKCKRVQALMTLE